MLISLVPGPGNEASLLFIQYINGVSRSICTFKFRSTLFIQVACILYVLNINFSISHPDICSIEGGVRLTGFNSTLAGYVEICKNETWLRLLTDTDSWTHKNSIVVCRQLGYLDALWLFDKSRYVVDIVLKFLSFHVNGQ